jgi:uncharacterized membrane protein YeaQ/YmgE (transglycosylase-associated protein family)
MNTLAMAALHQQLPSTEHGWVVYIETHGIIWWIIIGLIAGWLAGTIARGRGFGCITDVILGLVGAVIGGWIFTRLGILSFGQPRSRHGRRGPARSSSPHIRRRQSRLTPHDRLLATVRCAVTFRFRDLPRTLKIRLFRNEFSIRFYAGRLHTAFFFWC